jgi:integrase
LICVHQNRDAGLPGLVHRIFPFSGIRQSVADRSTSGVTMMRLIAYGYAVVALFLAAFIIGVTKAAALEQIHLVLDGLAEPYRTMVMVAACLGLRVSEIIGLQWADFDWDSLTVMVQRGVVHGRVGETKTEASRRPLPRHPYLFSRLEELRKRSPYTGPQDWVFANDSGRPRWQESFLDGHLNPAAARAGIGKIGWHTFRRTYSTMLRAAGVDIKVQQELLSHATIQSTMNVYTQAISEQKRTANTHLVEMVITPLKRLVI